MGPVDAPTFGRNLNFRMMKMHNFCAGPCTLPAEVFDKAADAVREFNGSGLSLLEISHRSKAFVEVMERARLLVRQSLGVPPSHEVLFLQGGASLGFHISALNFMKREGGRGGYVDTGAWSAKAIAEAKKLGEVEIVASSADKDHTYIPKDFVSPSGLDYLHITTNNTIRGTQFKEFPKTDAPRLADMSSDIFGKPIAVAEWDLIYAGAQKNLGPAGTTLYIVRKDALGHTGRNLPSILDLAKHIEKDSMYNTPPVFAVYVSMLNLEWMERNGGVEEMERRNTAKAELLYGELDRNPLFEGNTAKADRSVMNATFRLKDEATHVAKFDALALEAGISGIGGHRSVGGYRASMYNALPLESVKVLVEVMRRLETEA